MSPKTFGICSLQINIFIAKCICLTSIKVLQTPLPSSVLNWNFLRHNQKSLDNFSVQYVLQLCNFSVLSYLSKNILLEILDLFKSIKHDCTESQGCIWLQSLDFTTCTNEVIVHSLKRYCIQTVQSMTTQVGGWRSSPADRQQHLLLYRGCSWQHGLGMAVVYRA